MSPETDRLRLACPYCGGGLMVTTRSEGLAFMTYEVPDEIECDRASCEASWQPDGTPVQAAKWIEWPGLYERPSEVSR